MAVATPTHPHTHTHIHTPTHTHTTYTHIVAVPYGRPGCYWWLTYKLCLTLTISENVCFPHFCECDIYCHGFFSPIQWQVVMTELLEAGLLQGDCDCVSLLQERLWLRTSGTHPESWNSATRQLIIVHSVCSMHDSVKIYY